MTKYDLVLKLGFLAICGVTIGCMTALIICGKDGGITNTLLGVASAFGGVNLWQLVKKPEDSSS